MKQVDVTVLFFFPIALGFMAVTMQFIPLPTDISQVDNTVLTGIHDFWNKTALTIGILAALQIVAAFYLVNRLK